MASEAIAQHQCEHVHIAIGLMARADTWRPGCCSAPHRGVSTDSELTALVTALEEVSATPTSMKKLAQAH